MNKIFSFLFAFAIMVPFVAGAAGQGILGGETGTNNDLGMFLENVLTFVNEIIIPFILGIGFLFFVWGMFQYFIRGGHSDEAKESGKSLIVYALAGFVLIFAFWGIINLLVGAVGNEELKETIPSANLIE